MEKTGKQCFTIDGHVEKSRTFCVGELLEMERAEVADLLLACGSGDPKGRIGKCSGVLLKDLIALVNVTVQDHNDTKRMYVTVSSEDGYSTVFSWQELFNTQVGEGVMVLLEKDGVKVNVDQERVDLISARDYLTGPRYVKRLDRVRVFMIEPV